MKTFEKWPSRIFWLNSLLKTSKACTNFSNGSPSLRVRSCFPSLLWLLFYIGCRDAAVKGLLGLITGSPWLIIPKWSLVCCGGGIRVCPSIPMIFDVIFCPQVWNGFLDALPKFVFTALHGGRLCLRNWIVYFTYKDINVINIMWCTFYIVTHLVKAMTTTRMISSFFVVRTWLLLAWISVRWCCCFVSRYVRVTTHGSQLFGVFGWAAQVKRKGVVLLRVSKTRNQEAGTDLGATARIRPSNHFNISLVPKMEESSPVCKGSKPHPQNSRL